MPALQPLIAERKQILNDLDSDRCDTNRIKLNRVNAQLKTRYAEIKRDKWNELCAGLDSRSSNSKLWKLVKDIGKEQPQFEKCNSVQSQSGVLAQNDEQAANILGEHYQVMSSLNFTDNDKKVKIMVSNFIHGCRCNPHASPVIFHKAFSAQEFDAAISGTNLNTSPGPDSIHGQMISHLGPHGKQRLLDFFNNSWKLGRLPRDWKRAVVTPIRKPGKDFAHAESFRPIALTSIPCKIMEKMILKRLTFYLNSHNLLPMEQYGFREGHSTIDQVLYFSQKVRDAQNKKPTNHTVAAFLDLTKAFDRVWTQRLIHKLYDNFGIRGRALPWIYDFLRNRHIRVRFNGSTSNSFKISQGVPQGSVLSPLLFTLFIAGIENFIPENCEIGLFADDIVLWCSGSDIERIEESVNLALAVMWNFAENHKLNFNPSKSVVSFFTTNRKLYNYRPKILLNSQPLKVEKHPKYLGFIMDPEILGNKHLEHLALRARKRIKILKYISGRDWGADASTLRNTYVSLIRPILEYGIPIFCSASDSNLLKLERVQLSAARIITGLRNSCPNDIVLYEADLQPLSLRRNACLAKYYSRLSSHGLQNRSSRFLGSWSSNQRLKRSSPFGQAVSGHFVPSCIEHYSLSQIIDPSEGLDGVFFHPDLAVQVRKKMELPCYLKQLALERINHVPFDAVQMFTDGSKLDGDRSGSGIYIRSQDLEIKIQKRNPDFCSVFRSELIAILEGLDAILTLPQLKDIWIFSDSRSAIQHLADWHNVRDSVGADILKKLKQLSLSRQIHFQWIPSHVDVPGNEKADGLARAGASAATTPGTPLTYMERFSKYKAKNQAIWLNPPVHQWYQCKSPGGSLALSGSRRDQTAYARFLSGHLSSMTFVGGNKSYETCTKCSSAAASPDHILSCLGLSTQDLVKDPLLVLDFLRVNKLMDLI